MLFQLLLEWVKLANKGIFTFPSRLEVMQNKKNSRACYWPIPNYTDDVHKSDLLLNLPRGQFIPAVWKDFVSPSSKDCGSK